MSFPLRDDPVPLRADPLALKMMHRRSFNRACAAMAMTATRGRTSTDRQAQEVLRFCERTYRAGG
jgi:hypothetical protein